MSEKFFLSREITKNVKFSESVAKKRKIQCKKEKLSGVKFCLHVFLFLALPQQKYPHLVIPTGGPVDRSGGICFSESDTCCRCPDFARHDTQRSLYGYEYE